jgi:hypothetical protein
MLEVSPSHSFSVNPGASDYLYTLRTFQPMTKGGKALSLKAYADGNNRRLFFEGCLEEFIQIFGKN